MCLQFRKIFEKIAITSLVANIEEYKRLRKQFAFAYHPDKIIKGLRKENPDFYPKPSTSIPKEDGTYHFEPIIEGFLTEDELIKAWNTCSDIVHAENPYARRPHDYEKAKELFPDWLTKIVVLLNHHSIILSGGGYRVVGVMRWSWDCDITEKPQVTCWEIHHQFKV